MKALVSINAFTIHCSHEDRHEDAWDMKQTIYWICFKSEL